MFEAFLGDGYDAAILVQDYPPADLDDSTPFYLKDARAFIETAKKIGIPAAICSTLPENMDKATRNTLIDAGAAPMQGLQEALNAIAGSAWHARRRTAILDDVPGPLLAIQAVSGAPAFVDEALAKQRLQAAGLVIPEHRIASAAEASEMSKALGYPLALKMLSPALPHKTEAGAVRLKLESAEAVAAAAGQMQCDVAAYDESAVTDRFLLEQMADPPLAELMVGLRRDPQFGIAMTLASGGVLVELIADAVTLLLPATRAGLAAGLGRLRVARLLDGYRGGPAADRDAILDALMSLADLICAQDSDIAELEINPVFVYADRVVVIDALMQTISRP